MKLEAGKSYYRRDGGVESIVRVDDGIAFGVLDGEWWNDDGSSLAWKESPEDLISEVPSSDQAFSETAEKGRSVVRSWSSYFDEWWDNEGSGMPPEKGEDHSEHVKRMCEIAWSNGAYCISNERSKP